MTPQAKTSTHDFAVIGAGPAGLALTGSLARLGARVVCVDPAPQDLWPANYGAWADELELSFAQRRWDHPLVHAEGRRFDLGRSYVSVNKAALQSDMLSEASRHGAQLIEDWAGHLALDHRGAELILRSGRRLRASVVIDASGGNGFVARDGGATAWQTAWGAVFRVRRHPWADGSMVLMNWSAQHLTAKEREEPSFLYAMPLDDHHVFLEETRLATRDRGDMKNLQSRLTRRLDRMGLGVQGFDAVEHCVIPLDLPMPRPQPVVAFGAAAGMVHPISGYHLTTALRRVEQLAEALVLGLSQPNGSPAEASERGWSVVQPPGSEAVRHLQMVGLNQLLQMDAKAINAFFSTFFSMDAGNVRAMLDPDAGLSDLVRAMSALFATAPLSVRAQLLRHALSGGRTHLWRALARSSS